MIILISGGIGSGKTLSAIRMLVEDAKYNKVFTNFKTKHVKNVHRLKKCDLIRQVRDDVKSTSKTERFKQVINWQFWEEQKGCDIYLDEMDNLVDSRNSMATENKLITRWLAQIRKIFSQSGDQNHINVLKKLNSKIFKKIIHKAIAKSNNIICITQRVGKLDVRFRDLSHVYIQCQKVKIKGEVYIVQSYYFGDDNISAVEAFENGQKPKRTIFHAPPYYKYYDSYELISQAGEYL